MGKHGDRWRVSKRLTCPHVFLGSATTETRTAMAQLAADNLLAGLAGNPMPAYVNNNLW